MTREGIIRMAREAGMTIVDNVEISSGIQINRCSYYDIKRFAVLVAAAERKVIMDSLQKQSDLAADALDRRWALEMIAAVAARGETK